jgi:aspartyl-tRNA(Asn)/glutamyl-tRNA(Gln) amidotransferase subunit A
MPRLAGADHVLAELARLRELPDVDALEGLPGAARGQSQPARSGRRVPTLGGDPHRDRAREVTDADATTNPPADPAELGIVEAASLLRQGRLSAEELVQACLARVERDGPALNAFVTTTAEAARRAARLADRERRAGRDRGPLHGIPIGHKDVFWTRGVRTAAGSRILEAFVPERDAAVVHRLRTAGAVMLGKLQTHEFACGAMCDSTTFGPVRNPWDLARSPGGSSGGTAAAVAAGLVLGGTGTDTGGSIRIPAAWCGVAGLKPTYGVVSRAGLFPLAPSLDHAGPIARTVRDVAVLFWAMVERRGAGAQVRGRPPTMGHTPPARPPADRGRHPARPASALAGTVLGVPIEHFWDRLDPEVERLVRTALGQLERLGARLIPVHLPHIGYTHPATLALVLAEGLTTHDRWLRERPDDYGGDVRGLLELGRAVPAVDYLRALRARRLLRVEVDRALETVTALVAPALPLPAVRHGTRVVTLAGRLESVSVAAWRLTHPFNLTGHPALQVPVGFTGEGLPAGMQIVGARFDEATILGIGAAYEAESGWASHRPPLPTSTEVASRDGLIGRPRGVPGT